VFFCQYLIQRSPFVSANLTKDGIYGAQTSAAVQAFQIGERLNVSSLGVFDAVTANTLLALHTCDGTTLLFVFVVIVVINRLRRDEKKKLPTLFRVGYRDQGGPLPSGYKYKVQGAYRAGALH
jgi:hypothetical protein